MSSADLWQDIKNNPLALAAAVLLHVVLIVLLSMNLVSSEVHKPKRAPQKTVEAVVVDSAKVEKEIAKLKQQEEAKKKTLEREKNKVKQQIAAEKKRLADLKKKQEAERKKKLAEKKRQAELKKKREAEKKKKAEAERKKKLAAEKKRKEAERKKKEAAEKKRQAELKRKQEEAARRKREEEELKRKLAEEERLEREAREAAERAARLDVLRSQYITMIEQKVGRNWLRPAGVKTTPECVLHVTQSRLGDVLNVKLQNCTGDAVYLRSVEHAVHKASPLPAPPDPGVFDREILFTFRP